MLKQQLDETVGLQEFKNNECHMCYKIFDTKAKLKDHKKHVHKSPQICSSCNTTFSCKRNLVRHMKYKHDKMSIELCTVCGKTFVSMFNLRRHESNGYKIKINENTIKKKVTSSCSFCGKIFTTRKNLKEHQNRTHFIRVNKSYGLFDSLIRKYKQKK